MPPPLFPLLPPLHMPQPKPLVAAAAASEAALGGLPLVGPVPFARNAGTDEPPGGEPAMPLTSVRICGCEVRLVLALFWLQLPGCGFEP